MTDRLPELDHGAISSVKSAVNYADGTKCCKVCQYFGPDELSGAHNAQPTRCERNAFWFPVSEAGFCNQFLRKAVSPVPQPR